MKPPSLVLTDRGPREWGTQILEKLAEQRQFEAERDQKRR